MPANTFEMFSSQSWHEYTQDLTRNIENDVNKTCPDYDIDELESCKDLFILQFEIDDIPEVRLDDIDLDLTEPAPDAIGEDKDKITVEVCFPYDGSEMFFQIRPTAWIYQSLFAELGDTEAGENCLVTTFVFRNASNEEMHAKISKYTDDINSALDCLS